MGHNATHMGLAPEGYGAQQVWVVGLQVDSHVPLLQV